MLFALDQKLIVYFASAFHSEISLSRDHQISHKLFTMSRLKTGHNRMKYALHNRV